ncbi:hypothetical protein E4413_08785 [Leptospira interrogans]|uniref:hypothetical protein n=1 Tax=Leptospira interrogans TaxID=173 RepID=UPI0010C07F0C|nr:hypothetical protein [Leptospira interrogans]QCO40994.1 hypothetical protein E4413_08785 [Leptospira interrogans]UNE69228.1 hypothetical protein FH588_22960 [Leptospira interrogans]
MGLENSKGHNQEDGLIMEKEYLVEAEADLKEHTLKRDMSSLFVTFNRNTRPEESTALRLQTISQLYGLRVELPYRIDSLKPIVTEETKKRIDRSLGIVCISLVNPTEELLSEVNYANEQNKIIIHIHDSKIQMPPVNESKNKNLFRIGIDFEKDNHNDTFHKIGNFFAEKSNKENSQRLNAGLALIGIALGMLVLSHFDDDKT